MKIEASNRVIDDNGVCLIDSFWRHDCLIYMALREAGLKHEQAADQIGKKYTGGGPRPRFFFEDEVELEVTIEGLAAEAEELSDIVWNEFSSCPPTPVLDAYRASKER
jgi:hypothetical protein